MDRERILSLLGILKESSALELSVKEGDLYVRLRRPALPVAAAPVREETEANGLPAISLGMAIATPEVAEGAVAVTARLVGFFHRGNGPDSEPLVALGDQVKAGQTIGTIESLRQITAVTAPGAGTVAEIVAEEHQPVQFGDLLFVLRPGA
ncbi:MAG TPA: biotin/lipoyl-containing protein [Armatimonadota bacterium]